MPFSKGDPNINRNGRPKGSVSIIGKIKQKFEENPEYFEEYVSEILADDKLRRAIMEQIDGKPHQQMDVTSKGESIVVVPSEIVNKHGLDRSTEQDS